MATEVVILGGGNIGDVENNLAMAEYMINERIGNVVARSSLYHSEAWGFHSTDEFVNRAFVVHTTLSPNELLDATQTIEAELGRDREYEYREKLLTGEMYTSRKIDLDILLYGKEHISTERLQIPHPRIMQREFAVVTLCEAMGVSRKDIGKLIDSITGK